MVTNERQRLYAIEQRRSGSPYPATKKGSAAANQSSAGGAALSNTEVQDPVSSPLPQQPSAEASPLSPSAQLDNYHYNLDSAFAATNDEDQEVHSTRTASDNAKSNGNASDTTTYHVNILQQGARIKPRLTLNNRNCPGFPSLIQYIHNIYSDEGIRPVKINILGPDGQINVTSDETFDEAVRTVLENDWMDGEVKILVDVEKKD